MMAIPCSATMYSAAPTAMPRSLTAQAAAENYPVSRNKATAHSRAQPVALLKKDILRSQVVRQTGGSRAIVDRLYHAVQRKDESLQEKLLNPSMNRAGRKPYISRDESVMIKDRINYAAKHGLPMSVEDMESVMYEIASDGRKSFRTDTGLPSADAIRHWRAASKYITYRNIENKYAAKPQTENYEDVASFAKVLRDVRNDLPGIFRTLMDCGTLSRRRFHVNMGRERRCLVQQTRTTEGMHHVTPQRWISPSLLSSPFQPQDWRPLLFSL